MTFAEYKSYLLCAVADQFELSLKFVHKYYPIKQIKDHIRDIIGIVHQYGYKVSLHATALVPVDRVGKSFKYEPPQILSLDTITISDTHKTAQPYVPNFSYDSRNTTIAVYDSYDFRKLVGFEEDRPLPTPSILNPAKVIQDLNVKLKTMACVTVVDPRSTIPGYRSIDLSESELSTPLIHNYSKWLCSRHNLPKPYKGTIKVKS